MLYGMRIQEIPLAEIDAENELFRISEELDCASILDSVRESGQLNPLVVREQDSRKVIVCGFRRFRALRTLGLPRALAWVFPEAEYIPARLFNLALGDNLSHRQLDPLEKARVLFKLQQSFGASDITIVQDYLPRLGLNPHESVLHRYILIHGTSAALRNCAKEGRLTHASIETIAQMTPEMQDRIAAIMGKIRLSASLQKKVLQLLDDIAGMAGDRPGALLAGPEIAAIADDTRLSPFQRGERVYEFLYRLRNPRLSTALDRFLAHKDMLQLPSSIRMTAHPFFEEPGLHVEFDATDIGRFRFLVSALQEAAQRPELNDLFIVR